MQKKILLKKKQCHSHSHSLAELGVFFQTVFLVLIYPQDTVCGQNQPWSNALFTNKLLFVVTLTRVFVFHWLLFCLPNSK